MGSLRMLGTGHTSPATVRGQAHRVDLELLTLVTVTGRYVSYA